MYAYSGILAALLTRARTGEGTVLDVALIDTLGEWMTYAALYTEYGGTPPPRTGATHATIAPYGPYRTRDGAIVVAVQSNREWAGVLRARSCNSRCSPRTRDSTRTGCACSTGRR
jgi:crotonobetainyl-CoA:carnitine CoA-transferase CaiB-like acyl-CoA transferase